MPSEKINSVIKKPIDTFFNGHCLDPILTDGQRISFDKGLYAPEKLPLLAGKLVAFEIIDETKNTLSLTAFGVLTAKAITPSGEPALKIETIREEKLPRAYFILLRHLWSIGRITPEPDPKIIWQYFPEAAKAKSAFSRKKLPLVPPHAYIYQLLTDYP